MGHPVHGDRCVPVRRVRARGVRRLREHGPRDLREHRVAAALPLRAAARAGRPLPAAEDRRDPGVPRRRGRRRSREGADAHPAAPPPPPGPAGLAISSLNAVGSYTVTSYMPTFLTEHARLPQATALVASSSAVAVLAVLLPFSGRLGDRIGRRPVILVGTIGMVLLAVPGYLLAGQGSLGAAIAGQLLMVVPLSGISAVLGPAMCELFPTSVRYSGSALGYNVAYALFGGTAPFVAQFLITQAGTPIAPAFYMVIFGLVCLIAVAKLPETSRIPLPETLPQRQENPV
nr:MFS transporter [Nonomuraea terrae]